MLHNVYTRQGKMIIIMKILVTFFFLFLKKNLSKSEKNVCLSEYNLRPYSNFGLKQPELSRGGLKPVGVKL